MALLRTYGTSGTAEAEAAASGAHSSIWAELADHYQRRLLGGGGTTTQTDEGGGGERADEGGPFIPGTRAGGTNANSEETGGAF